MPRKLRDYLKPTPRAIPKGASRSGYGNYQRSQIRNPEAPIKRITPQRRSPRARPGSRKKYL